MIIHEDWIWLHFPKCAGTYIENSLRSNFGEGNAKFDKIDPEGEVIWHHSLSQRKAFDPTFEPNGKRVISAFRRLPTWLLSRIHFELSRPPNHVTSRSMFEQGKFYENTGYINQADALLSFFEPAKITDWLRQENLEADLKNVFGDTFKISKKRRNITKSDYVKQLDFWFTSTQLNALYAANPLWAELEAQLYGDIIRL
ncbi:hypothetical protein OU789_13960 [Halocynthiibacter sp. C4]|uniref:hypothetical protein n=1 Tax=Halocynthiibacter sp. C4 TaxID=2992758 RepID=UPI00237A4760|nr:hypothetical protein [Halocynthiibacter sp. C4]MDE0591039.1 hypothetical protein [Halocynthiibacter sp. C4]